NVVRLDVTMDDSARMRNLECARNSATDPQDIADGQPVATLEDRAQVAAIKVFHDEEMCSPIHAVLERPRDIRSSREVEHGASLAREGAEELIAFGVLFAQHLDRDHMPRARISRLINCGESPPPRRSVSR